MKRMFRKVKSALSGCMAFLLIFSLLPMTAFAADGDTLYFDQTSWVIGSGEGAVTVTATTIGGVAIAAGQDYERDPSAEIVLTGFDSDRMEAKVSAGEGYSAVLTVVDGKTSLNAVSEGTNFPSGRLHFSIEEKRDESNNNPNNNPNQNGNVRFEINNQNSSVIKYSLNGTNWYLVDADKNQEQYANNVNFSEADFTGVSKIYVKVELGENMAFDDYPDNDHTRTYLLVEEGGQPTDASNYNIEEALVSEGGFSFDYDSDNQKLFTVKISLMNRNPDEGGGEGGEGNHPQNNDNLSIKLLGANNEEIVLYENGGSGESVEGITFSGDNNNLEVKINNCNQAGYVLSIEGGEPSFRISGDNSFFGMALGENVRIELWGDSHSSLSIGGDGFIGAARSGIRFRDDLVLDIEAAEHAFNGVEEVCFNNYDFHDRKKSNNIIFSHGNTFEGVRRVEIYSSKTEIAVEAQLTDDGTDCVVSEEGQLILHGNPDNANFKTRYYERYPGDGQAASKEEVESCIKEVSIFDNNLSDKARASFDLNDEDGFVLTSLDPILYSVSYQVDDPIRDDSRFGDPDAGNVFMNGFEKGYWVENGTGGRFEAWIAADETVNVTILPEPGYQYIKNTLNINGMTIDTTPGVNVGSYSFVMGPHAGHICAGFIKTEDVVEIAADSPVKDAGVLEFSDGVVEAGNVKLEVAAANPSNDDMTKIESTTTLANPHFINLDLKLEEYVVKNYDPDAQKQEAWETPLSELNGKVNIGIELPDTVDGESTVQIVRIHDGKAEMLDCQINTLEENGEKVYFATFETDKFSTYSIAYKTKYKILDGDDQTATFGEGGDLIIRASGELKDFKGLKMDNVDVDPKNYEATEGSTIIRLKKAYLDTLPKGQHSLTFVYVDGEVTAHFTLQNKPSENNNNNNNNNNSSNNNPSVIPVKDSVPKTGESNPWMFIFGLMGVMSLLGLSISLMKIKNGK